MRNHFVSQLFDLIHWTRYVKEHAFCVRQRPCLESFHVDSLVVKATIMIKVYNPRNWSNYNNESLSYIQRIIFLARVFVSPDHSYSIIEKENQWWLMIQNYIIVNCFTRREKNRSSQLNLVPPGDPHCIWNEVLWSIDNMDYF